MITAAQALEEIARAMWAPCDPPADPAVIVREVQVLRRAVRRCKCGSITLWDLELCDECAEIEEALAQEDCPF